MSVPDFTIGSDVWPGLAKLSEEMAELQQVEAKFDRFQRWDHQERCRSAA